MLIIFDIETGPIEEEKLRKFLPPIDPKDFEVGPFKLSSVKTGGLKDPAKIEKKIRDAEAAHDALKASTKQRFETAKRQAWEDLVAEAPGRATTGRVEAIGMLALTDTEDIAANQTFILDASDNEPEALRTFWEKVKREHSGGGNRRRFCGHFIAGFDLPFLLQRSWLAGVRIPVPCFERNRWLNDRLFLDTYQVWTCGQYNQKGSLNDISAAFDGPGKPDDCDGKNFWRFWRGSPEQKEIARNYLVNDLYETARIAAGMQLV